MDHEKKVKKTNVKGFFEKQEI